MSSPLLQRCLPLLQRVISESRIAVSLQRCSSLQVHTEISVSPATRPLNDPPDTAAISSDRRLDPHGQSPPRLASTCGSSSQAQGRICDHHSLHMNSSSRAQRFSSDSSVSSSQSDGKFKIYTKTGDKGESSLYDGQRRRKDDPTFEALGDVDELNSALGLAHEYCSQVQQLVATRRQLEEVQSRLLDVGSAVATPLNSLSSKKIARVKFNVATVEVLEKWIDKMDEELPQLTSFILPSGGLPASSLHMARAICRRAERKVVTLVEEQLVDRSVAQYLNRLSDYLFTAARFAAMKLEKPETSWTINKR